MKHTLKHLLLLLAITANLCADIDIGDIPTGDPPTEPQKTQIRDILDVPSEAEAEALADAAEAAAAADATAKANAAQAAAEASAADDATAKVAAISLKEYRPETYGAVGDGVTNDTAAVQAAIDAAELTGGTVLLSAWYGIDTPGLLLNKGWVCIRGFSHGGWFDDGESRCGFKPLDTDVTVLRLQAPGVAKTSRGISLRDFSIVGTQAGHTTATTVGIRSEYVVGYSAATDCMVIDRVNVQWLNTGIFLETDDSPIITNSRLCDNTKALRLKNVVNPNVSSNVIYDNREYGLYIEGSCYGVVVNGNMFGRDLWSIRTYQVQSVAITGNHFTRDNAVPVSTDGAIWLLDNASNGKILISGNNFIQRSDINTAYDWNVGVIKVQGSNNVAITGNLIDYGTTPQPAVSIATSSYVTVDSNQFSPATLFPVTIANDASSYIRLGENQHYGLITVPNQAALKAPNVEGSPIFADSAAAITGGLRLNDVYRTAAGDLKFVIEDADAKAYADLVAAQVAVTTNQRYEITKFVVGEKAASRWTLHKRLHIFGWGNAAANAIGLVGGNGTWNGTVTHATGYSQANGTTGYFDLGSNPATFGLSNSNAALSALIQQGGTGYGTIIGQGAGGNSPLSMLEDTSDNIEFYAWAGGTVDMPGPTGVFVGTMTGANQSRTHKHTSSGDTTGATNNIAAGTMSTENMMVWRRGTDNLYGNARLGAVGVHTNMTEAQARAYSAALKTLWQNLFGLTLP